MRPRVVITDSNYPDTAIEREVLDEIGAEVVEARATTPEEVVSATSDADALLNQSVHLPATVFEEIDSVSVVARYGVGVDNVDIDAATENGVAVVRVPSYCEAEVATHTLALMLSAVRRTPLYDRHVKSGKWDWKAGRPIPRLVGSTLGFVAFGNIPQKVVERVSGFDFDVLAFDPHREAAELERYGAEKVGFEELLERSDVVTVHAPLTDETDGLFDADAFDRMRDDAVLVNTARGGIVEESALVEALEADQLRGAALDVMAEEPPESSPLFARDDVVLSPHVAWYSESSMSTLRRSAARGIVQVLRGERPDGLVNPSALNGDSP